MQDRETRVFAATAGLGAGKTHGKSQWHHQRVLDNPRSPFSGFYEPIFQKIHDAAIPTYKKVLNAVGYIEGIDYRIIKTPYPKLIYSFNNHEVHFCSAERPDKIVAVEYSHSTIDEAGAIVVEAYRNVRSRTRCTLAEISQVFVGGVPQGITWYAEAFDSDTIPGWNTSEPRDHYIIRRSDDGEVKYRRFTIWTDDNPFISKTYLQELQDTYGHNPNLIRSYRYGQFCPLVEGAAYKNYLPQKHDIDDRYAEPLRPIVLCFDFNANPLAWVALQATPFDEIGERKYRYVAIDEANLGEGSLEGAVVEFSAKFPVSAFKHTEILLYGDRSGHASSHKISGSDYDFIYGTLRRLGYTNVHICATKQVAPEAASVDSLNRLFLDDLHYVCKRCRQYRKSLMATCWKENTRKLDKPVHDTWTHWSDAVKYFAWQELREFKGNSLSKFYGYS